MKRILVFCAFYKPHLGGVEKYVENFYKRLPHSEVTIVTSKYDKALSSNDRDENLNIIRIDSCQILKDKYYIPTIHGLKEIIKTIKNTNQKETEIHTHTRFYLTNFIATVLARKYKIKHYHFEHGSSFVQDGSTLVRLFAYLFDHTLGKYILNKSEVVFPISEGVRKFLERNYPNTSGPSILLSTCDSAAKCTIKSIPLVISITNSLSHISPCTNVYLLSFSMSLRFSKLPAYVNLSKLIM